jgi:sugar-specific transcriptional regulator TrmB
MHDFSVQHFCGKKLTQLYPFVYSYFMKKNNQSIVHGLQTIGFSDKEIAVYISLLEIGAGTVSAIARKAGINRTTGYDILDSLSNKGLVSISGKEPKQEYVAESPERIENFIAGEIQKLHHALKLAQNTLVPELKSLHNISDRPRVRFYEGIEGLQEVYEDTLTTHEPIRAYATVDDMHRGIPNYFPQYYKRRAQAGIAIRAIVPDTPIGRERASKDKDEARETALVPQDTFYFSPEINIYDNKVMIASWREKLGIIIESAEIADAMKKIYELSWSEAKRLDKTIR